MPALKEEGVQNASGPPPKVGKASLLNDEWSFLRLLLLLDGEMGIFCAAVRREASRRAGAGVWNSPLCRVWV